MAKEMSCLRGIPRPRAPLVAPMEATRHRVRPALIASFRPGTPSVGGERSAACSLLAAGVLLLQAGGLFLSSPSVATPEYPPVEESFRQPALEPEAEAGLDATGPLLSAPALPGFDPDLRPEAATPPAPPPLAVDLSGGEGPSTAPPPADPSPLAAAASRKGWLERTPEERREVRRFLREKAEAEQREFARQKALFGLT